ncbi:MAG TPA: efflux RND transporter periplasmic adaptor subunit [Luteimonas sp.]|nr:efflux RND transporter periplasmic adaptor subunit [Luteimonas sp.]HRO27992.1 efflux RND transporter periplasmic adaptor subunit [Luteimonas sp.]
MTHRATGPDRPVRTPLRPLRLLVAALLAAALAACSGNGETPQPAAIEGLDILVVPAADAASGRAWDGVVEAVRQATLAAQTSGRVAEVRRDVGDRVDANELLVRLTAVEQQAGVEAARAQLHATEARAREADGNYARYLELSQAQYVSKSQLEQMHAARDSARAARDAARAQLANVGQQVDYTSVRAPYAGIVASRDVEPGESVGVGRTLMTVFAPEALRIEVSVPQSDAEAIRANAIASVRFHDGRSADAAGVTVFPAADAATHAVRVRIDLPTLDPVPAPGSTAKVVFPAVAGAAFPRIPASAVAVRGEVNAAYVLSDGRLALRQLRLGERSGGEVEVIAGLKPGETIAIDPVAARQALVAARGDD